MSGRTCVCGCVIAKPKRHPLRTARRHVAGWRVESDDVIAYLLGYSFIVVGLADTARIAGRAAALCFFMWAISALARWRTRRVEAPR